jgi:isopenicillin N synthase-like dioxygenase
MAVDKDDLSIPIIDLEPFLKGTPSAKKSVAATVTSAFKTSGFLYLKNHGIPPSVVAEVFAASVRFFARPQAEKDSLGWTTPQSNRGYVASGREKLSLSDDVASITELRNTIPDLKESMEIGRDDVDGLPNRWPDHLDDEGKNFKRITQIFFALCKDLHTTVMRSIAVGMGLPEHFFDEFTTNGDNNLRLLHYPPVSKEVFLKSSGQVRAGEHSDYGSITFLFQDSLGGLQVRSPKGTFVDATPVPDTIVVNAGDLMARWSNDIIKSTKHRVIQPPYGTDNAAPDICPARYSMAYFCNPNHDKFIEALPGTYGDGVGEKKYDGINSGQYLIQRLAATY